MGLLSTASWLGIFSCDGLPHAFRRPVLPLRLSSSSPGRCNYEIRKKTARGWVIVAEKKQWKNEKEKGQEQLAKIPPPDRRACGRLQLSHFGSTNKMDASLVLPVVLWDAPPAHVITSLLMTGDKRYLITGSRSGMLGVWTIASKDAAPEVWMQNIIIIIFIRILLPPSTLTYAAFIWSLSFGGQALLPLMRTVCAGNTVEASHDARRVRFTRHRPCPHLAAGNRRIC
jgi:hypothetical protein